MVHPCTSLHPAFMALALALGGGCTATSSTAETSFTRLDYLISDGQPDYSNHYPTVVQISTPHGACSGVLISSPNQGI